ncbi:MAG TPA: AAA family ATPase, partial [Roseiflexaceae bacterium]|nr:AAA family ATPase [Roseiflexaceae bacterium]
MVHQLCWHDSIPTLPTGYGLRYNKRTKKRTKLTDILQAAWLLWRSAGRVSSELRLRSIQAAGKEAGMNDNASFGYWVRRQRKALDLTQAELARRVGCAEGTIRMIEADARRPSRQIAARLADQLAIAPADCDAFIRAARAELRVGRLAPPLQHKSRVPDSPVPEQSVQLSASSLPTDFPPLHAIQLRPTKLPIQPNTLIGREREIDALLVLLRRADVRLVTLTGAGGMGKTRLAIALAEQLLAADRFPDGIRFVALAPLTAPEHIVPALAEALDFPLDTGTQRTRSPRQQVFEYLCEKRVLLVLDNLEQLLGDGEPGENAASLVAALLDAAPQLAILATSREHLRLREEQIYPLGGLHVPDTADPDLYGGVSLFVERARHLWPDFAPTFDDLGRVARICRLVEGMPLAIELAAGWVDTLALSDIATEIERGLDLLTSELRDVPARHHSMRVVFDASWRRLGAAERVTFVRLSVFRGGGTPRAVQDVTATTLPQLKALVGASLLHYDTTRDRYTIHELLRQYAAERLAIDPEDERATRDRHAAHYCTFLRDERADLQGARQREALAAIEADGENVRAAWEWAARQQHIALLDQATDSLGYFYQWQGRAEEGTAAFRAAAETLTGSPVHDARRVQAKLLTWWSVCTFILGDNVTADALLAQSLNLLDDAERADVDTRAERAVALLQLGLGLADRDYSAGRAAYERSRALFKAIGDQWGEAMALSRLG